MSHTLHSSLRVAAGLTAMFFLGGCLALSAPPPGTAALHLIKINSARVSLWHVWFEQRHGRLFLSGNVLRRYPAADEDTTRTHLKITLFNAAGIPLRELEAKFEPRRIPHGYRSLGYSTFSVPLDVLPGHTDRVQILAYDDTQSSPPPAGRLRP